MIQKELNEENMEIKKKAYELYEKHGFKNGNDFIDWLEAEKQAGRISKSDRRKNKQKLLYVILGILFIIIAILLIILFKNNNAKVELSQKSLSELTVMMLVLDNKPNEEVIAFGDTHFDYSKAVLTDKAKIQLSRDIQILKKNPEMKIRMAGYTSAKGKKENNQLLSEKRANAVRTYLIEKGIAQERITVIGYGRTKPALYEVSPNKGNTKEARANMRVLFEIVVK